MPLYQSELLMLNVLEVLAPVVTVAAPTDFVFTVEVLAGESFTLPLTSVGVYNTLVDWGDSSSATITAWDDAAKTHTYTNGGVYTIQMAGEIQGWKFSNSASAQLVREISSWGNLKVSADGSWFYGCSGMTFVGAAVNSLDTSHVTSCAHAFRNCSVLNSPISNMDTSQVTTMYATWVECSLFNQDLSSLDVSSVTNMGYMLSNTALSVENYGLFLVAWAPIILAGAHELRVLPTKYVSGGTMEVARDYWISQGWTIIDGGPL